MNYNWHWQIFWEPSPDGSGTYLYTLIRGLYWTLAVSGLAWCVALVVGLVIGVLRCGGPRWVQIICIGYVELFRNIPLLVQMFLWYFVAPELLPTSWGQAVKAMDPVWGSFATAVVCLGLFTSARIAELVRTGVASLPRGQTQAATALGLRPWQVYRHVLLPITARIILPPLTSEALGLLKNSTIAFTIGLLEITGATRSMQEFSFQIFEAFAAATLLYVLINLVVVLAMRALERRLRMPGYMGSVS